MGIVADMLDPECRGASTPTEVEAEMLAAHWWVEHCIELIDKRLKVAEGI